MTNTVICFSCNKENTYVEKLGLRDECESCGADLHVCKNCKFYDPGSYNECRESSADVQREKERANFCDYFQASNEKAEEEKKDALLSAAEALFKK